MGYIRFGYMFYRVLNVPLQKAFKHPNFMKIMPHRTYPCLYQCFFLFSYFFCFVLVLKSIEIKGPTKRTNLVKYSSMSILTDLH